MTFVSTADLLAILPELLVMAGGCLVLVLDPLTSKDRKGRLAYFSLAVLGAAFVVGYWFMGALTGSPRPAFSGLYVLDAYGSFWKLLLIVVSGLVILLAKAHLKLEEIDLPEFYAFILLSLSGMMVMVSGTDLLVIYLGLELMSLSLYVMAGFKRYALRSLEAAAKYFILGSFSSGILLYGISLLFGRTGSTTLAGIRDGIAGLPAGDPILMLAMSLLIVGFGFKVSAVPFHMWTPDVYEGSPTSVTAYISVASKAASFAAFLRVFLEALGGLKDDWQMLLVAVSVATMILGNVVAIVQTNIKRMLAYSSIAHAGYALIGLVAADAFGVASVILYLAIYAFMNLGAFAVVTMLRRGGLEGDDIDDFTGLARRNKWAAFVMLLFMFSLAGIPPTAGFIAKFYVFMAAVGAGMTWLAVLAVVFAAISAYFYLRVVMVMYMREPGETAGTPGYDVRVVASPATIAVLLVAALGVIILGLFPDPLIQAAQSAILPLR
ncbi:MAG: NADH-quinone oxidoreductase subunit N [Nitrospiraceae bacterium]|nr:MAG: NADH-quinone oxidoreductase subunit N [Nitrospiraceae bacterium]